MAATKITILIGTMTGTAQLCAQEMELALGDDETQVEALLMDNLDASVFDREGAFLICTSTYGQGDVPDNARALCIACGLSTLKGPITRAVSEAGGRELRIEGAFKPVWTWVHPRFRAEKVSYANPDWAREDYMFQADAVEVSIELLPLLVGRVILPEVHLQRPIINLEIDEQERKNWLLKPDQQDEGKGSRISILALTFDEARLKYDDALRAISLDSELATYPD